MIILPQQNYRLRSSFIITIYIPVEATKNFHHIFPRSLERPAILTSHLERSTNCTTLYVSS